MTKRLSRRHRWISPTHYSSGELGKKLQLHRKLCGLTQKDVAQRMGVRCLIICDLETGRTNVNLDRFLGLLRLYGVGSVDAFLRQPLAELRVSINEMQREKKKVLNQAANMDRVTHD